MGQDFCKRDADAAADPDDNSPQGVALIVNAVSSNLLPYNGVP